MDILTILVIFCLVAVAGSLLLGLMTMGSGGRVDAQLGTPLMWVRVGLQALAVVLLILVFLLR